MTKTKLMTDILIGFLVGWLVIVPIGTVLCLTGIGMVLGIPLVLLGLVLPITLPLLGRLRRVGACPHCGTNVIIFIGATAATCPDCHRRLLVRSGTLRPAP